MNQHTEQSNRDWSPDSTPQKLRFSRGALSTELKSLQPCIEDLVVCDCGICLSVSLLFKIIKSSLSLTVLYWLSRNSDTSLPMATAVLHWGCSLGIFFPMRDEKLSVFLLLWLDSVLPHPCIFTLSHSKASQTVLFCCCCPLPIPAFPFLRMLRLLRQHLKAVDFDAGVAPSIRAVPAVCQRGQDCIQA